MHALKLSSCHLEEICDHHEKLAEEIITHLAHVDLKIIPEFHQYLRTGYYPYFQEIGDEGVYWITLEQNLHTTIESDLTAIYPQINGNSVNKIKKLLIFIANSVPFVPNWNKIKEVLEVGDLRTLKSYFKHLEDAGLVRALPKATQKFSQLETPAKVYLENPNQLYAIASQEPNKGTLRETFFLNMVSSKHTIKLPKNGDFIVDDRCCFEVGGRNKSFSQLRSEKDAYLACDNIEKGIGARIPLWLFGFLY